MYICEDFESPTLKLPFTGTNWVRTTVNKYEGNYSFGTFTPVQNVNSHYDMSFTINTDHISFWYFSSSSFCDEFVFFIDNTLKIEIKNTSKWINFSSDVALDNHKFIFRIGNPSTTSHGGSFNAFIDNVAIGKRLILIQDGNNICNTDGSDLSIKDTLPFTIDLFDSYGIADLSLLNTTVISKLINDKYNIAMLI